MADIRFVSAEDSLEPCAPAGHSHNNSWVRLAWLESHIAVAETVAEPDRSTVVVPELAAVAASDIGAAGGLSFETVAWQLASAGRLQW